MRAISAVESLAELAHSEERWEYACWLYAVTDAERKRLNAPVRAGRRPMFESAFADIRAAIGDAWYEAASIRGHATPFEATIDQILLQADAGLDRKQ